MNRLVASRAEAWIETVLWRQIVDPFQSRLPRGGVDRNSPLAVDVIDAAVASRAEAWIETARSVRTIQINMVASRAEAWIETYRLKVSG